MSRQNRSKPCPRWRLRSSSERRKGNQRHNQTQRCVPSLAFAKGRASGLTGNDLIQKDIQLFLALALQSRRPVYFIRGISLCSSRPPFFFFLHLLLLRLPTFIQRPLHLLAFRDAAKLFGKAARAAMPWRVAGGFMIIRRRTSQRRTSVSTMIPPVVRRCFADVPSKAGGGGGGGGCIQLLATGR